VRYSKRPRLQERLGFVREGQVLRMRYTDGRYCDDILFGMTAEEFAAQRAHG